MVVQQDECAEGEQLLTVQPVKGARLNLIDGQTVSRPAISIEGFRNNIARAMVSSGLIDRLMQLPVGYSILYTVDIGELKTDSRPIFLIANTETLPKSRGPL